MYNFIRHFKDYLRLRAAIKKADEQHAKDGDRYYVTPSLNGQLLIMDRKNFRKLKQKHYIEKNVTLNDLRRECFYHTPYSNGTDAMPDEERKLRAASYYSWCNIMHLKNKKHGKK